MLLVSAFTSALFALGIYVAAERLERTVLNRHIRAEFDALAAGLEERPHTDSIRSALLVGYVGQDNPALPAEFAALPPGGYHAVRVGEKAYQVYVGETAGSRLYVAYDISEWEALERPVIYVLIAGVVMSSLAAVWIGFRAASQVIAPVTALAQRLKALDPRERNVRLGREFTGAEVATIAEAFDRYMERLDGFVEREQLFTSAAAHELRTPLAVMRGAVDVLLEQPDLSARARRAVERVERATREMHEFIEALLFLSRETRRDEEERAGCEFRTIVENLVLDHRTLAKSREVAIELHANRALMLDVPPALPTIVVSNLLRNAIENTRRGQIVVELEGRRLRVSDTGRGIGPNALPRVFERSYSTKPGGGMGLHLTKRICEQFGWNLKVESDGGKGTAVTLDF